jgi:hypothetical protein
MHNLDYSGLLDTDIEKIELALSNREGETVGDHIGEKRFGFVLRNYRRLAELGILETNWMSAYLHASHFNDVPLSLLRDVFDTCDKNILQKHYPIPVPPCISTEHIGTDRISLFRGCAGPDHRMGMSWLTSLDKAIWYAAHHVACYGLGPTTQAVYASTVDRTEIYCCGEFYDFDYIVCPKVWWRVDVPISEFRLDRPRW